MKKKIIIGTRGSKLALVQTEIIKNKLTNILPDFIIENKIITTTGDKNMSPVPLDNVGKDWFTKEIDRALLDKEIDIAVHSLKDLSEELPEGLIIAAIPEREDAREAFVSKKNIPFTKLKKGALIGTDSIRRKVQLVDKRPDLVVKSIRGNVNTRLEKLDKGQYDGIFLAVAGLKRLDLEKKITEYFSETDIVPAPGQGALAVVIRKNNKLLLQELQKLNHESTIKAVTAERSFSKVFGGGCSLPIGAYANDKGETIRLVGMLGSLDGKHILKDSIKSNSLPPEKLGKELAENMIQKSKDWYDSSNIADKKRYVILTRPEKINREFIKKLKEMGLQGLSYPTIAITGLKISDFTKKYLYDLSSFDWILFTSKNGVRFFIKALKDAKVELSVLHRVKIGAVGSGTAEEVKKYQLSVHFISSQFTTENFSKELKNIKGKKILLPRADIATSDFPKFLEKDGAEVVNMPIYQTKFVVSFDKRLEKLLKNGEIFCITFTSASTVKGFLENIKNADFRKSIFAIPVLSIGPVTTKALTKAGFQKIYTADTFTEEGMLAKLKESIL